MNTPPISVSQLFPQKRTLPLDGLYLGQNLLKMSTHLKRPFVYTNYVSDINDIIALRDKQGDFQIPNEVKNLFDWLLFQELEAQADAIITSSAYLRRLSAMGEAAEDVLSGFEPENRFENLGVWRLQHGYKTRSPHIAIVTRSLDFPLPDIYKLGDRKVAIFTLNSVADSYQAKVLSDGFVDVIGCGSEGADGNTMIQYLYAQMHCRTIEMTTGPTVLKILLDANVLDRIYISQVQRKIPVEDASFVKTILSGGSKLSDLKDFVLTSKYEIEKATLKDGTTAKEQFLSYDHK